MFKTAFALAAVSTAAIAGMYATGRATPVVATSPASPSGADAAHPAVIELFQSQGCSSCPPALAVLDRVANRPDVLALNFAVTYWDQLGWKDSYARPEFTARQWEYSRAQGRGNVQTPQLIVNGRAAVLGSVQPDVERAIAANRRNGGPDISTSGGRVTIGRAATGVLATVWLASYDPRTVNVPIRAGENGGRTLPHRNIVRTLVSLGAWRGSAVTLPLPASMPGLSRAVLVQAGKGGAIVAATRI